MNAVCSFAVAANGDPISYSYHMYYSEKTIERRLRIEVDKLGGKCLKWVSPGFNGVPDRIILMPGGRVYFVETKSTGDKPRAIQIWVHKLLAKLGFEVWVIDDIPKVLNFIRYIKSV